MIIKTWDITGMGGGYEETTQKMLWNAVKFGKENDMADFHSKQASNTYGIAINDENETGKKFDKAMMEDVDNVTGAMHQCATNHAIYILKNGYNKWYEELKSHREGEQSYNYEYDKDFDLIN